MKTRPAENVIQRIRQCLAAKPFVPFYVETTENKRYRVASSAHAAVSPKPYRVVVWLGDGGEATLAASKIGSVEIESKSERNEARFRTTIAAIKLLEGGSDIKLIAKQLKVAPGELTKWIGKFRLEGVGAFHGRRHYRAREPITSSAAITEAMRREKIILAVSQLRRERNLSLNYASRIMNIPLSSLHKWLKAYHDSGFRGLLPRGDGFGPKSRWRIRDLAEALELTKPDQAPT